MFAGVAESAGATRTLGKFLHDLEMGLNDRHDDHLRKPCTRLDLISVRTAIPARYIDLALVIGIDQADEIAEHDPVLVA